MVNFLDISEKRLKLTNILIVKPNYIAARPERQYLREVCWSRRTNSHAFFLIIPHTNILLRDRIPIFLWLVDSFSKICKRFYILLYDLRIKTHMYRRNPRNTTQLA